MEHNILLTITMLVSDREDTIEKCMLSLKKLMEKVPSELIVVDTANNLKCMDIVRKYTDKIVSFKWCDDFSAARNAGLEVANGQWIMFLDDDEWFESTEEIESFFINNTYLQYGSAAYITRNYGNFDGTNWSDRIAVRLCKFNKNVRFKGKIHEYLNPIQQPTYYMKDYVHHYGYVFSNAEEKLAHSWRNIQPLAQQRKEYPDDFQIAGQLLQEYVYIGEKSSALELAREMRTHSQADIPKNLAFTSYAMIKEVEIYHGMNKTQIAYKMCENFLKKERLLLIAKGCLQGLMVGICCCLEKYEEALNYIEKFKKSYEIWKCKKELHATDLFSIAESFFNEDEVRRNELLKLNIYVKQQNWKFAEKHLCEIDWKAPWKRMQIETSSDVVEMLIHCDELKDSEKCMDAIVTILSKKTLRKELYKAMEKLNKEEKIKVLTFLTKIEPTSYQLLKYHLIYHLEIGNTEKVERLLGLLEENNYSIMLQEEDYWIGLNKVEFDIASHVNKIPLGEYFRLVSALYKQMNLEVCKKINQVLCRNRLEEDIRYRYLKAIFLKKVLTENYKQFNWKEIWEYLIGISQLWISCAKDLYREETFENEYFSALPDIFIFSWWIMESEKHIDNVKLHIKDVSEAAKCYLPLSDVIKKYLEELQKKQTLSQNTEFIELMCKIKEKVKVLIEFGKVLEAEETLMQLIKMMPDDWELLELQRIIENKKVFLGVYRENGNF